MFRSRWTGPDEEWTVMAGDVRYAARPTREAAVAVMDEQLDLARKFGDNVRVVRTVAGIKSRPIPWWKRKMRLLLWRIGNPDLKAKAWRRRRERVRRLAAYEKEDGMTEDLQHDGEDDPTKIREDVGTRIAPDVKVPDEVEESLRREREGDDEQEEVQGG